MGKYFGTDGFRGEAGITLVSYSSLTLYMPDHKNEPAGIEKLLPWSDFIKEHCTGLIDVENVTPENHMPLPF